MPFWVLSSAVCLVYALLIGIPPELNAFGELLSLLIAGPLQLGLCIYFLKISNGSTPTFFDLFEGFKPLLNVLLAFVILVHLPFWGSCFLSCLGLWLVWVFQWPITLLRSIQKCSLMRHFSRVGRWWMEKKWNFLYCTCVLFHGIYWVCYFLLLEFLSWFPGII